MFSAKDWHKEQSARVAFKTLTHNDVVCRLVGYILSIFMSENKIKLYGYLSKVYMFWCGILICLFLRAEP